VGVQQSVEDRLDDDRRVLQLSRLSRRENATTTSGLNIKLSSVQVIVQGDLLRLFKLNDTLYDIIAYQAESNRWG
jgi:hypothetical protein